MKGFASRRWYLWYVLRWNFMYSAIETQPFWHIIALFRTTNFIESIRNTDHDRLISFRAIRNCRHLCVCTMKIQFFRHLQAIVSEYIFFMRIQPIPQFLEKFICYFSPLPLHTFSLNKKKVMIWFSDYNSYQNTIQWMNYYCLINKIPVCCCQRRYDSLIIFTKIAKMLKSGRYRCGSDNWEFQISSPKGNTSADENN